MHDSNDGGGDPVAKATPGREVSPKTDLRILRTRKMLWESLVRLVEERDFNSISVGEIAAGAMVNRTTFYRHYEDKRDLLERGTAEVVRNLAHEMHPSPAQPEDGEFTAAKDGLLTILDHVADHAEFYRIMLASTAGTSLRRGVEEVVDRFLLEKIRMVRRADAKPLVPDVVTVRVVSSVIVGIISWWITEGQPITRDELVESYLRLMVLGPYACLGFDPPGRTDDR